MQQFVGQCPWEWQPVWERLARRMVKELEPDAIWVIDDTGFPKQGGHSVGVERQYSGTLGKTANCQVVVSLHEVCTEGAAVLSWRLYLPESWANDLDRRAEAGYGDVTAFGKSWSSASCGIQYGSLGEATPATQIETEEDRASAQCVALRQAAAYGGQRSCAAGARLEESSLAGRRQRLAGVSLLLGGPRAAFPWISPGPRARQRDLATGRVVGENRGARQVFLL